MSDLEDIFSRSHQGLPREAPGSRTTTRLLLELVGRVPDLPDIIDIGCGTGPSAVALAELTGGRVTAVDTDEDYLAAARKRALDADVTDQVRTLTASMDDIPLPDQSSDLLWAEGAAYVIGFDAALSTWRRLLRPGGSLVLTEAEWLTPYPAPEARTFWNKEYPGMRTTAENVDAAQKSGWNVAATYVLPPSDWQEYYCPLRARLDKLIAEGVNRALVAQVAEEIELYNRYGEDYGYTGYILRPR